MPRRAVEHRRHARPRLLGWIWWLLGVFLVAGLFLFVLQHNSLPITMNEKDAQPLEHGGYDKVNHTEELLSSTSYARQLADQMILAKAYLVIAKEHGNLQFAWELSSQIRNCQRILSEAAVGGKAVTVKDASPVITQLARLIYRAQDAHYDISTALVTLKSHAVALRERTEAALLQSAEFGQIAAEAVPKGLHCLMMRLTEEWFADRAALRQQSEEHRNSPRLTDNNLYHFCVFSDNVLATSVVVNSTVSNADHPQQLVFHIVTDATHLRAMTSWFLTNDFKGCTVEVRSVDEFTWLDATLRGHLTTLNDLRFYIPQIHPHLEKVVFLDEDVVVQKDLTPLFSVELHGNVVAAVETCLDAFHRLHRYLNFSHPAITGKFDPQACGWAFGMNVFDLIAWKKANATEMYNHWQEQNADQALWQTGTLPVGLLTFYGLVEPLDRRWHVLGLGYDVDIDSRLIDTAAVVHYSGHMKPWLKLGIEKYKPIWDQYVNFSHPHIAKCNVR